MGLRARILLPVAIVLVAALVGLGMFTDAAMRVELDEFLALQLSESPEEPALEEGLALEMAAAAADGGIDAVREHLETRRAGGLLESSVVLLAPSGEPLAAASDWFRLDEVSRTGSGALRIAVERDGRRSELLLPATGPLLLGADGDPLVRAVAIRRPPMSPDEGRDRFAAGVRRSATTAVAGLALLALLSCWWVVSRALAPVEQLRDGVRAVAAGDLSRRVAVNRDDELGRLAQAFNRMASALEKGEELRRHMVADVAHELRTPLTALRCQLEAIQDGLAPADRPRIDALHEEVLLLGRLVEDLQVLADAEAGALALAPRELELAPVVAQAAEAVRAAVGGALDLRLDLPDGVGVLADPTRLQQVVRNLLANAAVHGAPPVEVSARARGDRVRLSVVDHGPGVPVALRERVFERFYRVDPSRDRTTGGAGVGLTIVARLVEAQGGSVGVDPAVGGGASFWVELPSAGVCVRSGASAT